MVVIINHGSGAGCFCALLPRIGKTSKVETVRQSRVTSLLPRLS
jgi:hypothetical protein